MQAQDEERRIQWTEWVTANAGANGVRIGRAVDAAISVRSAAGSADAAATAARQALLPTKDERFAEARVHKDISPELEEQWNEWAVRTFPNVDAEIRTRGTAEAIRAAARGIGSEDAASSAADVIRLDLAAGGRPRSQPLWHVVLLFLVTLSLYYVYWSFRNWRHLRRLFGFGYQPLIWTAALVIATVIANTASPTTKAAPLVLAYFVGRLMYGQFKNIEKVGQRHATDQGGHAGWWALLFAVPVILAVTPGIPDYEVFLLSASGSICALGAMLMMQRKLNRIWETLAPQLPVRPSYPG